MGAADNMKVGYSNMSDWGSMSDHMRRQFNQNGLCILGLEGGDLAAIPGSPMARYAQVLAEEAKLRRNGFKSQGQAMFAFSYINEAIESMRGAVPLCPIGSGVIEAERRVRDFIRGAPTSP